MNARKRIWQPLLHEKHAGTLTGYAKVTAADALRSGTGSGAATGARAGEKAAVKPAGQAGPASAGGSLPAASALSALCGVAAACLAPLAAADAAATDGAAAAAAAGVRCKGSSTAETQRVDAAAALSVLKMHGAAGVMLGAASSADKCAEPSVKQSRGERPDADAVLGDLVSGASSPGAPAMHKSESAAARREVGSKGAQSAGTVGGEGRVDVVAADEKAREEGSGGGGDEERAMTCPELPRTDQVVQREDGRKRDRESETNNVIDKVGEEKPEVRAGKRQVRRKEAIAT